MEFGYSKEQVLLRELYRKFAETEVKPLAEELDEEERFPVETVEKLARFGFLGIPFPKKYGGAGGDYLTYAMVARQRQSLFLRIHLSAPAPFTTSVQRNRRKNTLFRWQRAKNWAHSA